MEKPLFSLSDIPEDWEIRLDDSFVLMLDKLNRPWAFDGSGKRRGDAVYWYRSTIRNATRKKMTEKELEYYYASYRFSERLWGWKRRPRDKGGVKNGLFIKKEMIAVLREGIDISDSELEKAITGIKVSSSSERILGFPRLPIEANRYWAWIMGLFYSSGSGRFRKPSRRMKREGLELAMKVHNPVIEYAEEIGEQIGITFKLYDREADKMPSSGKSKGLRTGRLRHVGLGWPEYVVLEKFGLSIERDNPGLTIRYWKPKIPEWVKQDDECMLMFIEGMLNGGYGVSALLFAGTAKRNLAVSLMLRIAGHPKEYIKNFATAIQEWFISQELHAGLREFREGYVFLRGKACYEVSLTSWDALYYILGNMNIVRPDLRARLLLRVKASEDPVFNEAILQLRSPHNLILGMISEKPRTLNEIDWSLQIKREGVIDSLRGLQMRGMIKKVRKTYHLDLSVFLEREIRRKEDFMETISNRVLRYSSRLLYRCIECGRVYMNERDVCGRCGSSVQPVARKQILQSLHQRRTRTHRRLRKLRGEKNGKEKETNRKNTIVKPQDSKS
ncbi:hypothetical protein KKH23_09000 [Patescibacteria group bacterium]|nr:hypothetical protein [Patescibacteria group bacterium]MBU0847304.1 hypothetical protein [Patescibacteria group bacterium]